jgi:hypothetical protein
MDGESKSSSDPRLGVDAMRLRSIWVWANVLSLNNGVNENGVTKLLDYFKLHFITNRHDIWEMGQKQLIIMVGRWVLYSICYFEEIYEKL